MNNKHFDDTGYRRLWAAVVHQAIKDAEYEYSQRLAFNWIFSRKTGPGSLRWICDMLDLDYCKIQNMCMSRQGRRELLGRSHSRENVPKKSPGRPRSF